MSQTLAPQTPKNKAPNSRIPQLPSAILPNTRWKTSRNSKPPQPPRKKLQREIHELDKFFWLKYQPFFYKSHEIVTGMADPSRGHAPRGIPDFWTAMKNHSDISMQIEEKGEQEKDEQALRYLTDVTVEYLEGFDFKLKEFMGDYPDPVKVAADQLDWRPGKCLAGLSGGKRSSDDDEESFFTSFSPPKLKAGANEDGKEEFEFLLEDTLELAELFKDELIPRAVEWYTGQAVQEDSEDNDNSDEDDEEHFEDSEDNRDSGQR
ncbi:NAP domain-containing protein [Aspergillus tanneri]|uniref:Nucleosome assembly n=1 Tax=Aspergillus tanneri TaxID=1220188 RepID=A0A5M9MK23_9EURO|nr:nucleosome assembly [Aspergillus tanneri]KAA8645754.1 nucleosome assembly [Aspergillus tanneri]